MWTIFKETTVSSAAAEESGRERRASRLFASKFTGKIFVNKVRPEINWKQT